MDLSRKTAALDVRALPGTREALVYHDGGLFPVLSTAPDGAILAVLRSGAGHLGLAGRLELVRTLDGGATWSPPAVVADSGWDDRNPALGLSRTGTLILGYFRLGRYDAAGIYRPDGADASPSVEAMVTRSADGGLTWEPSTRIPVPPVAAGSPYGKVIALSDGMLLMPIYTSADASTTATTATAPGSYLIRSRDDGKTWEDPSLVAAGMDETALLLLPDGDVLAALRASDAEAALWIARSGDGGRTWSTPVRLTGPRQHPADLVLLTEGTVLLTYGNRTPPYRIEGRLSRDGGRTWSDRLLLFSGPLYGVDLRQRQRTDLGYPSSMLVDVEGRRRGVTMYYYNPSIPQSGAWREEGPTGPFYRVDGYRAVAISWDERELLAALAE